MIHRRRGSHRPTQTCPLVLAILLALSPIAAWAKLTAILVGVSGYPQLPSRLHLTGPSNDVILFRQTLLNLGFNAADIRVLADGVPDSAAQPNRAAILNELDRLATTAASGDRIVLYFAGHGARQPADPATIGSTSLDGFEAIFLPLDAAKWSQPIQAVVNAITNHQLRDKIAAMRARGAFVWAILDSCNSQYMVRGASPLTHVRGVSFDDLGIPAEVVAAASQQGSRGAGGAPPSAGFGFDAGTAGGYVGFFAAQSTEETIEFPQPAGDPHPVSHGLFTFNLARALQTWPKAPLGKIADQILGQYSERGILVPTPSFVGESALSQSILGPAQASAEPQWRMTAAPNGEAFIPAGTISTIATGSVFAVLANAVDPTSAAIGYVEARNPSPDRTPLYAIKYQGVAPLPSGRLVNTTARLLTPRVFFTLRVALPGVQSSGGPAPQHALTAIQQLAHSEPSTSQVIWQPNAAADTDVRLSVDPPSLWLLTGPAVQRSDLTRRAPNIALDDPQFGPDVHTTLDHISKALNLVRIANQLGDSGPSGLTLTVTLKTATGAAVALRPIDIPKVTDGDSMVLHFENTGFQPVDVTVLYLDSQYTLTGLYPSRTTSFGGNRIAKLTGKLDVKVLAHTIDPATGGASTLGLERVIVIATAGIPEQPESNYLWLANDKPPAPQEISRGFNYSFSSLLRRASFHTENVRGAGLGQDDTASTRMRVISWRVDTARQ